MVYTIKNSCVEEPDLPYEDGAMTIFLYTKGTEGKPPEELVQLARYMEDSTAGNAKSEDLAWLHEMVTKVKADREVGLAYMKAVEIEKRIRSEGKAEGKAEDVLVFLGRKGEVPSDVESAIRAQTDTEVLTEWLLLAANVKTVGEFQEQIGSISGK
ncbi:MAG TPA: hypothetical protein DDY31_19000 [Lachnospiraceae bacterium]|nr:hypothetical protein [Lachnospiraceae bacterium]